ncbi:hypothetical protein AABB24_030381 [Solanum stoloniferum]|uniref:Pre-mRNA-splicing factor 3 domain-containing protein n=1 Tax=Solanum stoloniferum TaxID=62892 RepID=A0ABD2S3T2_9SOLN
MERAKSSRRERGSRDGDGDDAHRRHRHRSKHHRDEENRHRSDDRRRQDRERSIESEGSRDRGHDREDENQRQINDRRRDREREGSIDRAYDRERREKSRDQDRCEKLFELEVNREDSMERRNSHKRKDRGENVDRRNVDEKRARGSEVKKDKLRVGDVKLMDKEDAEIDEEKKGKGFEMRTVKEELKPEPCDDGQGVETIDTSAAIGSYSAASRTSPDKPLTRSDSPATKVSSISTTNENKGVNINRFHKVLGKSSTDEAARDTGKSATLSIDAKGNANDLKQRHKVLKEKLKRIPLLNKGANSTRDGSSQMGSKESLKSPSTNVAILPPPVASSNAGILPTPGLTAQSYEAMKRAQVFFAKIEFRQDPECPSLTNMFPGQMPSEVIIQPKLAKATVLRLDAFGREIDEQGNVVNVPKPSSTLKVNINKQNKESFQLLKPELDIDPDKNPHFDPRMGIDKNKILRPKKMSFQFVEEGKWSRDAEIIKLKSQFGELRTKELRTKQVQLAKAKAEPDINPNLIEVSERIITKEESKEPIPDVEWWDAPLLRFGAYGVMVNCNLTDDTLKMERITIYVEHPSPIEPPAEPAPPPPQPLKLTKKEQKKMRTRRRMDQEREKQEMILKVKRGGELKFSSSRLLKGESQLTCKLVISNDIKYNDRM